MHTRRALAPLLLSVLLTAGSIPGVSAQVCDYPATGTTIAYAAPATGLHMKFEDVALRAGKEQVRRELEYQVRATNRTETEWEIRLASGQAVAIRTFMGLIQTANSSGGASEVDREVFAGLWPLDAGKSVTFTMSTVTPSGTRYASEVSMCVRRFETLSIPAGDFDAVVIDSHRRIATGADLPYDELIARYWYVPQLGTYVQRVGAMYSEGREVMKQTRRALTVSGG